MDKNYFRHKVNKSETSPIPQDFTMFRHFLHFELLVSTLCGVEALWNGAALLFLCKDIAVTMEV